MNKRISVACPSYAARAISGQRSIRCTLLRIADDRAARCDEVHAITTAHVVEIDRKLADFQALRNELVRRLDSCRGPTIGQSRTIETLAPNAQA
jgi:hypothetical protein